MRPIEELMKEHEAILDILDVLDAISSQIEERAPFSTDDVARIVDFLRRFADGCHHAKEEKHLFPALEQAGIPRENGPIGMMLSEHDLGRKYIAAIAGACDRCVRGEDAAADIASHARLYARLLRDHINKENRVLFPMAERFLTEEIQDRLASAFAHLEEVEIGRGVHEQYHAMLHELHDEYLAS